MRCAAKNYESYLWDRALDLLERYDGETDSDWTQIEGHNLENVSIRSLMDIRWPRSARSARKRRRRSLHRPSAAQTTSQLPLVQRSRSPYGSFTDLDGRPGFAFGHGLSYGNVVYKSVDGPDATSCGDHLELTVTLHNDGTLPAEEVVQVYCSDEQAQIQVPNGNEWPIAACAWSRASGYSCPCGFRPMSSPTWTGRCRRSSKPAGSPSKWAAARRICPCPCACVSRRGNCVTTVRCLPTHRSRRACRYTLGASPVT